MGVGSGARARPTPTQKEVVGWVLTSFNSLDTSVLARCVGVLFHNSNISNPFLPAKALKTKH